jgi:NAD(P)-dependent dehydrogenase (short-subunit alcohol dehydrogenase family)
MGDLVGKVVIVSGAGSGIGLQMVRTFAGAGASLVASDVSEEGLERAGVIQGVTVVAAAVARAEDVERMVGTAIERHGRLDILVNNAGILDRFLPAAEIPDELWERVLRVNLTGPFLATKRAIPVMIKGGGGVIINIASIGGLRGASAGAAYIASKHGLIGLSKNTAANYATDGIRCIAICPGGVTTSIDSGKDSSERGYTTLSRILTSMPRLGSPAEIANIALFCASDEASFLNGAVIVADGGWTAH